MRRRIILAAGGLIAAAVVGIVSFSQLAAQAPGVVRIGSFFTAIDYAPYLIAKEQGRFEKSLAALGMKVQYTEFQTLPTINEAFANNQIDVVFEAEPPAIIGRAAGVNLQIVGLSCSLVQEIMVPKQSSRQSLMDLKGARIAVLAGTSSHYGVLKNLQGAGLSRNDFSIVDMVPPNAKAAFAAGQVDAWAVWPPFVEQELVAGTARTVSGGDARIQSVVVMRTAFVTSQRNAARAVAATIAETKEWMLKNPAEAQQTVAKALNLPLDVVKLAWPKHDWRQKLDDSVIADIQAKADFLASEKLVRRRVDVKTDLVAPIN